MSVLSEQDVCEIVKVVWMTLLERSVEPCVLVNVKAELFDRHCVTANSVISGAWHGEVHVRCSQDFLASAAAHMFSISIDDVEHQDCVDTLIELTHMLGGTIQCLLPEVCDLALPTLVNNDNDLPRPVDWHYFFCQKHPIAIALTEKFECMTQAA